MTAIARGYFKTFENHCHCSDLIHQIKSLNFLKKIKDSLFLMMFGFFKKNINKK